MTTIPKRTALVFIITATVGLACANLPGGMDFGGMFDRSETTETSHTEHHESSVSVNDEEIEHEKETRSSTKRETVAEKSVNDIGATCKKNDECQARACWVGGGNLGYCTKMCNRWTDCPKFWKCKKPGNAPQKICIQKG